MIIIKEVKAKSFLYPILSPFSPYSPKQPLFNKGKRLSPEIEYFLKSKNVKPTLVHSFFALLIMKKPIYSLTRKLARMSWNKYNLFNIATKQLAYMDVKTLFQQKWLSKRETRAYHGDELTERQFKNKFFDPKLPTVLASDHPPVASLLYANLERRLDFVVFRSNFCPSIYAARQLCVHGKVQVNGKKASIQ